MAAKGVGYTYAFGQKSVRPHVPLIKFKKGGLANSDPRARREPLFSAAGAASQAKEVKSVETVVAPKPTKKPLSVPKGPTLEWFQVPPRYRRRGLSDQEIEYINRGGPE